MSAPSSPDVRVYPDPPAVARAAAEMIARTAAEAVDRNGAFSLVLSGGSTPKLLHNILSDPGQPYRSKIDWPKVEIYFGDERAVPPDHADSNYKMARETLLSKVPIPPQNVHRIRGEIKPDEAAIEYGRMLKSRFGETGGPDLTLLGMGDDGHTASLFPHTPALDETRHRAVAQFVEKSTTGANWRITMTAPFINRSAAVAALVTGAGKAQRLKEVLHGPRDSKRLPIQLIAPASGRLIWLVDQAAAGALSP
jgi:6-phosphogluconolactonase